MVGLASYPVDWSERTHRVRNAMQTGAAYVTGVILYFRFIILSRFQ